MVGRFRLDNLPDSILNFVSQGLTSVGENGEILPGIASSWESKDGGKTWVFHIADKKTWQDGKNILSSDIRITFSDVKVEKPDPKTIVFKLQTPFSPFPAVLTKPLFKKGFLGTGEWKVEKVTAIGNIVEQIRVRKIWPLSFIQPKREPSLHLN